MSANTSFFAEVKFPHQKIYDGVNFPAILSPADKLDVDSHDQLSVLTGAIKEQKPWLESLLHRDGAILFHGFDGLATASDFNNVVEAFGYEEMLYVGGAAPRTKVVGRVYTANESPPHRNIPFHHELSHVPEPPSKLFFFCEVEAASGGETSLVDSHVVYERMKECYPEFVEKLEMLGLIYTRIVGEEDDPSSGIGRSWKSTFWTTDKTIAHQRAAELGMKLEWIRDGVKMIIGPTPAIRYNKTRQRKTWFNYMVPAYTAWEDERNDPKKTVSFGDGTDLPENIVNHCLKIMEEESINIPWQKGDILLMDNLAVLHARKPFHPPRRILASLCY